MKIRKKFKVESAHIVRNCHTDRCKRSIHGHSAIIELILHSTFLDNAGMLVDFNIVNKIAKPVIDAMDHTLMLWNADNPKYLKQMKKHSDRWIEFNFNPSAENLAIWLHSVIERNLETIFIGKGWVNGEDPGISVDCVRYHETETGYAESESNDINNYGNLCITSISDSIMSENQYNIFNKNLTLNHCMEFEIPEQQVK